MAAPSRFDRVEPWERQEGEGPEAFEAFSVYRDMGPTRSIRAACRHIGKARSLLGEWSVKWSWAIRATAYDVDVAKRSALEQKDAAEKARKKHATIGSLLQQKALQALQDLDAGRLKPSDLIRMMELGVRMERDALGLATGRFEIIGVGQQSQVADVSGLGPEEALIRMRQLGGEVAARLSDRGKAIPAGLLRMVEADVVVDPAEEPDRAPVDGEVIL